LHQLAVAHFELWLLTGQSALVAPATCAPPAVDACMKMLECAASKAAGW